MTREQMATLAGVAGSEQWRKCTVGQCPRPMGVQMVFYVAAQLELDAARLTRVVERMGRIGGTVEFRSGSDAQESTEHDTGR